VNSLLDHLETERASLTYEQLVSDIRGMAHCPDFPKTEGQLRALERAGRIVRKGDVVRRLVKREPQQATLF
jgi:hypothetical protein